MNSFFNNIPNAWMLLATITVGFALHLALSKGDLFDRLFSPICWYAPTVGGVLLLFGYFAFTGPAFAAFYPFIAVASAILFLCYGAMYAINKEKGEKFFAYSNLTVSTMALAIVVITLSLL